MSSVPSFQRGGEPTVAGLADAPGAPGRSLLARLAQRAREQPEALGLVLAGAGPGALRELSWAELDRVIGAVAGRFVQAGVRPGDVVLVLSASPEEQALGFLGVLAAGALPSILSFPSIKQSEARFHETLGPIVRAAGAGFVAASSELAAMAARAEVPVAVVPLDTRREGAEPAVVLPPPATDFLQFSSGTTGLRKCVRITGAMFEHQAEAYGGALGLAEGDRVASWLPLYHDMGLVACLLLPLYHGKLSVHLSPFAWLKQPVSLFQVASAYRATLMWLPNFAYKLCADQVPEEALAGLDLGALRGLINCSEPVRAGAHERLLERFGGVGVRPSHLLACYAMAEATFAVTQTPPGLPARVERVLAKAFFAEHRAVRAAAGAAAGEVLSFVSSGRAVAGVQVEIDGAAGEPGRVGEILIRGPGVISGYGADGRGGPEGNAGDGWFRTGDLGYLDGGELFVTGRAKDLIIHRGSNLYPSDLEEAAEAVAGVRPGRVVAFGVEEEGGGTEEVVIAAEVDGAVDPAELSRRVREEVWLRLQVAVAAVEVVAAGSLKKSTSGKLSRGANRDAYLARVRAAGRGARRPRGDLAVAYAEPRDLWERQLTWIWEEALGVSPIGVADSVFLDLGAGSLAAMAAIGEIQRLLGQELPPSALLAADTIARQAALLRERGRAQGRAPAALIPLQRRGRGTPLFLVHAAGGWAFPYVALARLLGEDRSVYAFQTPALETGEGAALTIPAMAESYLAEMRAVQPRGPYLLGGWSLGGLLAFEMATRLEQAGERVGKLVLFDSTPPRPLGQRLVAWTLLALVRAALRLLRRTPKLVRHVPLLRSLLEASPAFRFFTLYLLTGEERDIGPMAALAFGDRCDPARLSRLPADEAWDEVIALARAGATAEDRAILVPGLDGKGARRALRVSRRLEQLNLEYQPTSRYHGDIDVIGVAGNDRLGRWQRLTSGRLEVHSFPIQKCLVDPHFDMMEPANLALFVPALGRLLAAAEPQE